jgi:hypothetical protein
MKVTSVNIVAVDNCYNISETGLSRVRFIRFVTTSDGYTWKLPIFDLDFSLDMEYEPICGDHIYQNDYSEKIYQEQESLWYGSYGTTFFWENITEEYLEKIMVKNYNYNTCDWDYSTYKEDIRKDMERFNLILTGHEND